MQFLCHSIFKQNSMVNSHPTITSTIITICKIIGLLFSLSCVCSSSFSQGIASQPSMLEQAQIWLAKKTGTRSEQVRITPTDSRLKLSSCLEPFQFDLPFNNFSSLRVRCSNPLWQIYLHAQVEAPTPSNSTHNTEGSSQAITRSVLTLIRPQARGSALSPADVEIRTIQSRDFDSNMLTDPQSLEFTEAQRDLAAGMPLRLSDIRSARMVKQGQDVTLTIGESTGGFKVSVRLEALQDAKMGERVQLKNRESGKTVTGVVTGPNLAKGL
jgi:flagella basal body P-ring formation protein FlgA